MCFVSFAFFSFYIFLDRKSNNSRFQHLTVSVFSFFPKGRLYNRYTVYLLPPALWTINLYLIKFVHYRVLFESNSLLPGGIKNTFPSPCIKVKMIGRRKRFCSWVQCTRRFSSCSLTWCWGTELDDGRTRGWRRGCSSQSSHWVLLGRETAAARGGERGATWKGRMALISSMIPEMRARDSMGADCQISERHNDNNM